MPLNIVYVSFHIKNVLGKETDLSVFFCLFWFVVVLFALSKATKYNPFHSLDSWKVSGTTCPKSLPFHLILLQNIHEFNYESLNLLFHMLFR